MGDRIQERRACERFIVPGAVVNYKEKGVFFSGKYVEDAFPVCDISRGGMSFLSNLSLKIGVKLTVKIIIPGWEEPIILKGVVRWIQTNPEKSYRYRIGIQFSPYGKNRGDNGHEIFQKMIALEKQFLKGTD